ncbi:K(+)-transporting ATPase subunit F, partial [Campylobacter jejuni]|nr:K(+)-transporting ATPase subunit F [Campylobacter jejuni]
EKRLIFLLVLRFILALYLFYALLYPEKF